MYKKRLESESSRKSRGGGGQLNSPRDVYTHATTAATCTRRRGPAGEEKFGDSIPGKPPARCATLRVRGVANAGESSDDPFGSFVCGTATQTRAGSNCPEGTKGHPPSSRMEMHCHTFSLPCPSFPLPFFLLLFPKDGRERAPWLCISFPSPPDLLSSAALQSSATRLEHGQFGFRERLPRRQPPPRAAAAARLRTSTRPSGRAGALLAPLPAVSAGHMRGTAQRTIDVQGKF